MAGIDIKGTLEGVLMGAAILALLSVADFVLMAKQAVVTGKIEAEAGARQFYDLNRAGIRTLGQSTDAIRAGRAAIDDLRKDEIAYMTANTTQLNGMAKKTNVILDDLDVAIKNTNQRVSDVGEQAVTDLQDLHGVLLPAQDATKQLTVTLVSANSLISDSNLKKTIANLYGSSQSLDSGMADLAGITHLVYGKAETELGPHKRSWFKNAAIDTYKGGIVFWHVMEIAP